MSVRAYNFLRVCITIKRILKFAMRYGFVDSITPLRTGPFFFYGVIAKIDSTVKMLSLSYADQKE
jgi:hypothetical protein